MLPKSKNGNEKQYDSTQLDYGREVTTTSVNENLSTAQYVLVISLFLLHETLSNTPIQYKALAGELTYFSSRDADTVRYKALSGERRRKWIH